MLGRLDLAVGALDVAVGADEKRQPGRCSGARVVRRAVGDTDLLVGVAEKREVEVVLLRERSIRLDGIEADAEDLNVVLAVL
jgi:hypothetical protein